MVLHEMEIEMEGSKAILDTLGGDMEEWKEAQSMYGPLKADLDRQIGRIVGSEGLGEKFRTMEGR